MYRTKHRLISLLLCLLLLLPLFPAVVTAEEQATVTDGVTVVSEVESKRTAFEKHYLLSNGNYYAVSYAEAIHEQDQNGKWVDVDNTPVYSAKAAAHSVKGKTYSAAFDSKKGKTTLTDKDGKALSWHYELLGSTNTKERMALSANRAVLQSTSALSPKGRAVSDQEAFALPKAQGSLRFEKAFGSMNADLSYTVSPQKIKEDVILYTKGEVTALSMVVENCAYTAELSGANVLFKDKSGKTSFKVDAPYMFDAAGADSTDVAVSLVQKGTTVTITYTPSASWLNAADRVYPVTFDPAVTTNDYQANIEDMSIMSNGTTNAVGSRLYLGKISSNNSMAYFRINNLPQTGNLPITAVTFDLSFYAAASSTVNGKTLVMEQLSYTGAFSALTYTTSVSPVYDIDTYTVVTGATAHGFDMLTAGFLEAAAENAPFTCRLRFSEELSSGNLHINSMESNSERKPKPLLTVFYGYENPSFSASQIFLRDSASNNILKMTGTTLSMVDYNVNEARAAMALEEGDNGVLIKAVYEGVYLDAASITAGSTVSGSTSGDEWLIRQVSDATYLISPASAPTLALSRTSSGIVLQKVSSALAGDQHWKILDTNGSFLFSGRTIEDGIYYINNQQTRTFLIKNGTTTVPTLQAGTESALGDKMAWKLTFIGNGLYMIESVLSPNHYLHASAAGVSVKRIAAGAVPANAKFHITANGANEFFIKSGTNHYLASSASSATALTVATSPASVGNRAGWRVCEKEEYDELSDFSIADFHVLLNESVTLSIGNTTTFDFASTTSDFRCISANSALYTVNGITVTSGSVADVDSLTIEHIPTGVTQTCIGWFGDGIFCLTSSTGRLNASSTSSIGVADAVDCVNENFGKQLWYTEFAETTNGINYYYIHSLGIRDSNYTDNNVLKNSSILNKLSLTMREEGDSTLLWQFHRLPSGEYQLINKNTDRSLYVSGTSLTASASNATLWALDDMFELDLPSCSWSEEYAGQSGPYHVKIVLDSSVTSISAFQDLWEDSSPVWSAWNSISDNLIVYKPTDSAPENALIVTIVAAPLNDDTLGQTTATPSYTFHPIDPNDTMLYDWSACTITLNSSLSTQSSKAIQKTIIHEIGHALKLSHKRNESPFTRYGETQSNVLSIMNQGLPSVNSSVTVMPSFLDKFDLITKWRIAS